MPNSIYQLSYQVCPIILTGGVANQIPGGMLPMLTLLDRSTMGGPGAAALGGGIIPASQNDLDNAFGAFNILPGGTLVSQSIAKYPFANQDVAANAVIREPLTLSLIMDAPMRWQNAWKWKLMVFTALKQTLNTHNNLGGTYTVATPAFQYDNLIMTSMTDNSRGNNSLPQNAWRFDFEKPMVALADLESSLNLQMSKINNQTPTNGQPGGPQQGLQQADTTQNEGGTPFPGSDTSLQKSLTVSAMLTGVPSGGAPWVPNYPAAQPSSGYAYSGIS